MSGTLITSFSLIAYSVASGLMWQSIKTKQPRSDQLASASLFVAVIALLLHAAPISINVASNQPLNFGLTNMTVLISTFIMLIFLLGCFGMRIRRLGILMFPMAGVSLLFATLWDGDSTASARVLFPLSAFSVHVLISILAYSILTIAMVQSLLYVYQERQFKKRAAPAVLASLPPLQTMEQLLFRLLGMGFALLTLAIISGSAFSQQVFDMPFVFNHHTVLAILGWCVFAVLLYKRLRHGLRGEQATWWTVVGFLLIQLGYFGTKFINESINL